MFGFLTPVRNETADPLRDVAAARLFWQSLPKHDPIAARQEVCKALAEPVSRVSSGVDRLEALLTLDQCARTLLDTLLVNDVARSAHAPSTASRPWQEALELCRCFGRAYARFLRLMRDEGAFEGRRDCQSLVLLRLFRHRKRELLLRLFSEGAPPFSWREVHDAYRFAESRAMLRESLPLERTGSPSAAEATLEREYVHVLIQDLMNSGNFSPGNASWVAQRIPRWCEGITLARDERGNSEWRFVVDPSADGGLARSNAESAGGWLCVDMAPLLKSIREEIASLSDAMVSPGQSWSVGRRRQLRALQKVSALCAAEKPVLTRRGERAPTAMAVEAVMGLQDVLRAVRARPEHAAATVQATGRWSGQSTSIPESGVPAGDSADARPGDATAAARSAGTASTWRLTMVDRSDSGCRLHGSAPAANPPIPGALIAFREGPAASWNLAVVRRVKRRMAGKRVEIGAEYLGNDPQCVVVVVAESDSAANDAARTGLPRVAGLYLSESAERPVLPIKTLILPPCGLSPGDRVFLRSRAHVHTIGLKEPFEERGDFIWSPFEILDP